MRRADGGAQLRKKRAVEAVLSLSEREIELVLRVPESGHCLPGRVERIGFKRNRNGHVGAEQVDEGLGRKTASDFL